MSIRTKLQFEGIKSVTMRFTAHTEFGNSTSFQHSSTDKYPGYFEFGGTRFAEMTKRLGLDGHDDPGPYAPARHTSQLLRNLLCKPESHPSLNVEWMPLVLPRGFCVDAVWTQDAHKKCWYYHKRSYVTGKDAQCEVLFCLTCSEVLVPEYEGGAFW